MGDHSSSSDSEVDCKDKNDRTWIRNCHEISLNILKIREGTATIRNLLLLLQTSQNDDHSFQKLHEIQHDSTELVRLTLPKLKYLSELSNSYTGKYSPALIDEEKDLIYEETNVVDDFFHAITELQTVQQLTFQMHQDEQKNRHRNRNSRYVGKVPKAYQNVKLTILKQQSFDKDECTVQSFKDRKKAITELVKDIDDLRKINQHLYPLRPQQQNIGRADENTNRSKTNIYLVPENLKEKFDYVKEVRDQKVFLMSVSFLTFIIVAGIIVLVVIFT